MTEPTFFQLIDWRLVSYALVTFSMVGLILTLAILMTRNKLVSQELCHLYVNDDANLTKVTPAGITLLTALLNNKIPVPSPCGGKATCKQCRVQVLEGGGEILDVDRATFSRQQLKEGWRLSCQSKVKQDMKLHIEPHLLDIKCYDATVIRNDNVATFIKELVLEMPQAIDYRAGGYMQVHVPPFHTNSETWKATMDPKYFSDWEKFKLFNVDIDYSDLKEEVIRAYSMASYPAEAAKLMFNIRIATPPITPDGPQKNIPWGLCSSYTFSLKPGDKIKLSGPYGESFMKDDDRDIVFLIGGAGSSFGRAHIMQLFRTQKTKRTVTLWYGARSLKENIYQSEYEQLEKEFSNFNYNLVLSNPLPEDILGGWPAKDPLKTNFAFKAFELGQLQKMLEPENALFYVCGPPLHNQSVMKLLDDYGVARTSIVLDDFGS